MMTRLLLFLISAFVLILVESRSQRSTEMLASCMDIADPLIHNPNFIFPQKIADIREMCQRWDGFVDCIRKYTTTFWSSSQQMGFDKAINPSMHSIHQLCVEDEHYERAYLYYAPCMKKIAIERDYCGTYYNLLAGAVRRNSENGPTICCAYHKFRSCTLKESRECDKDPDPTMPTFGTREASISSVNSVSSMFNGALGFLHQKCSDYEHTSQDCVSYKADVNLESYDISDVDAVRSRDSRIHDPHGFAVNDVNEPSNSAWNKPDNFSPQTSASDFSPSLDSSKYKPHITVYTPSSNTDRFTWTTVTPNLFPTRGLRGPESQQYRGSAMHLEERSRKRDILIAFSLIIALLPSVLGSDYLINR